MARSFCAHVTMEAANKKSEGTCLSQTWLEASVAPGSNWTTPVVLQNGAVLLPPDTKIACPCCVWKNQDFSAHAMTTYMQKHCLKCPHCKEWKLQDNEEKLKKEMSAEPLPLVSQSSAAQEKPLKETLHPEEADAGRTKEFAGSADREVNREEDASWMEMWGIYVEEEEAKPKGDDSLDSIFKTRLTVEEHLHSRGVTIPDGKKHHSRQDLVSMVKVCLPAKDHQFWSWPKQAFKMKNNQTKQPLQNAPL